MKRRTFQGTPRGSTPPAAEPARAGQHIVLRIVLIVFVALFLAEFVPAPWSFHIGSRFTPLGQWDGYGPVQASDGGRYLLFPSAGRGLRPRRPPRVFPPRRLKHPARQREEATLGLAALLIWAGYTFSDWAPKVLNGFIGARGLSVTRLARGVPVGGELEYVDAGTIARAMLDRRSM